MPMNIQGRFMPRHTLDGDESETLGVSHVDEPELSRETWETILGLQEEFPGRDINALIQEALGWYMVVKEAREGRNFIGIVEWPGTDQPAKIIKLMRT